MAQKSAAVLLADGFEEIEAATVIDVLRRAGVHVHVLGVGARSDAMRTGSHGLSMGVDGRIDDVAAGVWSSVDALVLPGGMPGAAHLRDDAAVQAHLVAHHARGGLVGAICAAPIALVPGGLLAGRRATCFPGFEAQLVNARVSDSAVVVDGNVVTSRGVGTALSFALALVDLLVGAARAEELRAQMLVAGNGARGTAQ